MSVTFTKLFASITESTIWVESNEIRIVWICMLAMADKHGRVFGSIPGLASRARVPVKSTREAIHKFLSPDPDSRTKTNEGRRIEEIDGGWRLLNHAKYRAIRDEEDRREYLREKQAESRQRRALLRPELEVAAKEVMSACVISDPRMLGLIAEGLDGYAKTNDATLEDAAERMVSGFQEYKQAAQSLRFTVGLRKFFGHGLWYNQRLWPVDQERLNEWQRATAGSLATWGT